MGAVALLRDEPCMASMTSLFLCLVNVVWLGNRLTDFHRVGDLVDIINCLLSVRAFRCYSLMELVF